MRCSPTYVSIVRKQVKKDVPAGARGGRSEADSKIVPQSRIDFGAGSNGPASKINLTRQTFIFSFHVASWVETRRVEKITIGGGLSILGCSLHHEVCAFTFNFSKIPSHSRERDMYDTAERGPSIVPIRSK